MMKVVTEIFTDWKLKVYSNIVGQSKDQVRNQHLSRQHWWTQISDGNCRQRETADNAYF